LAYFGGAQDAKESNQISKAANATPPRNCENETLKRLQPTEW